MKNNAAFVVIKISQVLRQAFLLRGINKTIFCNE